MIDFLKLYRCSTEKIVSFKRENMRFNSRFISILVSFSVVFAPISSTFAKTKLVSPKAKLTEKNKDKIQWHLVARYDDAFDQKIVDKQISKKIKNIVEKEYVMERSVRIGHDEIPMGSVTQYIFKRTDNSALSSKQFEAESRKTAEDFRRSAACPDFLIEKKDQTISFFSDWKKYHRLVRIVFKDLGSHFSMSIALSRRGYAFPVFSEAILVQDAFADQLKSDKKALNFDEKSILKTIFKIQEAQAQSAASLLSGLKGLFGNLGSTIDADTAGIKNSIGGWVGTVSSDVRSGVGAINNGSAAINGISGTVQSVGSSGIAAFNNGVTQFGALGNRALNTADNGVSVLNRGANSITGLTNEIDKVTRPKAIMTLSAASFLTPLVLGAAGAGIYIGGAAIFREITGSLSGEEKRKLNDFYKDSFKTFDESSNALNDLEGEMDDKLAALAEATDQVPSRFLDKDLKLNAQMNLEEKSQKMSDKSSYLTSQISESLKINKGHQCPESDELAHNRVGILSQAKTLSKYADALAPFKGNSAAICKNLQELFNKWTAAESAIYYAKNQMLKSFQSHIMSITGDVEKFDKQVGNERKLTNECLEPIKKLTYARQNDKAPSQECLKRNAEIISKTNQYSWVPGEEAIQMCRAEAQKQMIEDLNSFSDACLEVATVQGERNHTSYYEGAIADAKRNMDIAKDLFDSLKQMDCVKDLTYGDCDGKADGSFTEDQKKYDAYFAKAKEYCPILKSHKKSAVDEQKQVAADGKSEDPELKVRSNIQCGAVCGAFTYLRNAWDRIF